MTRYGPVDAHRPAGAPEPADDFAPQTQQLPPTAAPQLDGPRVPSPRTPRQQSAAAPVAAPPVPAPPVPAPLTAAPPVPVDMFSAEVAAAHARWVDPTTPRAGHGAKRARRNPSALRGTRLRPDRLLGRRPAAPLLAGLVVGITAAVLLLPSAHRVAAPSAQAEVVAAPGQVTGLALGDDRLPDCTPVVAGLTPRQKLAQRLLVGVAGDDPAATARLVHETQIGGILAGGPANTLLSGQALRTVQAESRLPLTVAVDDEGGRVQRVEALDGPLPSARTLGSTRSPAVVQQIARDRARALAARGVTMNLAPDVDVSAQANTAFIGDRSFSSDADTVTSDAAAFAQGEREAGIFPVLKHFPGHGNAVGDSHRTRVTTPPLDQLRNNDLAPYAALLRPGGQLADPARTGVLVGHLDVPGLTDGQPASLTPAAYTLLRNDYHFDGLVLTDDLGALPGGPAVPDAVQRALAAGADMALWTTGEPVGPVLDGLEQALTAGTLDAKADDVAVERVLAAKGVCTR